MITCVTVEEFRQWRDGEACEGRQVGFVPTMGALHAGHRFLLERAHDENQRVVLSIFKNPTQFNDPADLHSYPETLEADLRMAEEAGVDAVLVPSVEAMYPDDYAFRVVEDRFARILEGAFRPGHFEGVLTVVLKLLMIVRPQRAYFGKKDFQQYELVKRMAEAFFLPVEIVPCSTIREIDGLPYSSRNVKLSRADRERAGAFPRLLAEADHPAEARAGLQAAGFTVDYVEEHLGRRFGAVRLSGVRLLDNFCVETRKRLRRLGAPALAAAVLSSAEEGETSAALGGEATK